MDRNGLALFRKLKASGQAWITKFNNNFRLSYIKKTQLIDYLPDAAGRPPKLVISQVPYCQATYMLQLKQVLALQQVTPPDMNDQSIRLAEASDSPVTEGSTDVVASSADNESEVAESRPVLNIRPRPKPTFTKKPIKTSVDFGTVTTKESNNIILDAEDSSDKDGAYAGGGFKCPKGTRIGPNKTCLCPDGTVVGPKNTCQPKN
jgi:hypothetical protein